MARTAETLQGAESTRKLFAELVSDACDELGQKPSPQAAGYVVELLDSRVRTSPPSTAQPPEPDTLAEALVEAFLEEGASRWVRLRALGDRALFDAGFFSERVERTIVGLDYYADIGRTAYARLSAGSDVFRELAHGFRDFVTILAEVGDRARGERSADLLRLYDRYRAKGSECDRVRLIRHGLVPPAGADRLQ